MWVLVLNARPLEVSFFLGTGHFPHQQRRDATEAWLSSPARLDEILASARFCDCIVLGMDCNQNLTLPNSTVAGLSRLIFLCGHRGLEFSPLLGNTWEARSEFSSIDWLFFRWPGIEPTFHLKPDTKTALPSDHVRVVGIFRGRASLLARPPPPPALGMDVVDGLLPLMR